MSTITPPPPPATPFGNDPKAAAAAAKAYAKAQRPWFRKKRFMIPLLLVVIAVLASTAGGGSDEPTATEQAGEQVTAAPETPTGPETVSGNTENPPQADLHGDTQCTTDGTVGWVQATGTLTNNSSETSSYMISVSFNDAAGTRFAEGTAFHNDVRSGESAVWEAVTASEPVGEGWTCEVVSVERFASQ